MRVMATNGGSERRIPTHFSLRERTVSLSMSIRSWTSSWLSRQISARGEAENTSMRLCCRLQPPSCRAQRLARRQMNRAVNSNRHRGRKCSPRPCDTPIPPVHQRKLVRRTCYARPVPAEGIPLTDLRYGLLEVHGSEHLRIYLRSLPYRGRP